MFSKSLRFSTKSTHLLFTLPQFTSYYPATPLSHPVQFFNTLPYPYLTLYSPSIPCYIPVSPCTVLQYPATTLSHPVQSFNTLPQPYLTLYSPSLPYRIASLTLILLHLFLTLPDLASRLSQLLLFRSRFSLASSGLQLPITPSQTCLTLTPFFLSQL
ncbi:hypothetical protein Pmani_031950 [Petrolisthes manimaculis]|uniref:Uncharacterized protein n=1 Tax=Petrolisthes manimaculis TaxID=1843537 RepID=A0AAE1NU14_9EUCA|nr:hypothetical protein Pmani_031950 [Petrolisthes manimaculis]